MKRLLPSLMLAAATAATLTGCATTVNTSGRVYSDRGALSQQTAEVAVVVSVRNVEIKPRPGSTSTYVGTAIGGAAGYAVTSHSTGAFRGLGTIIGGAAGAAAGSAVSAHTGAHPGLQIFVQRLSPTGQPYGALQAVVQDADQAFSPGQRVLLIHSRDGNSIAPLGAAQDVFSY